MVRNTQGSALLLVLIMFSLVSILGMMAIKDVLWANDLHQAVYEKEQQFCFAQGALDCAIVRAKKDFDLICKNKRPLNGTISFEDKVAQLHIAPKGALLIVSCQTNYGGKAHGMLRAELAKDPNNKIRIQCFQR